MKLIERRIAKLESERAVSNERPTHFVGIKIETATDEELEAMATLCAARDAALPRVLRLAETTDEVRSAIAFLTERGADVEIVR